MTTRTKKSAPGAHAMSLDVTTEERAIIMKIARRAQGIAAGWTVVDMAITITAAHANGCSLRLQELLDADNFNFVHDICGLDTHISRETGKLDDSGWSPRFGRREVA